MSGVEPGFPGLSVQNRADLAFQEPDVRLGGPDVWPDGPDVRPEARMSGPTIPDFVWGGNFRIGDGN